jgi:hypothetical protein
MACDCVLPTRHDAEYGARELGQALKPEVPACSVLNRAWHDRLGTCAGQAVDKSFFVVEKSCKSGDRPARPT